MPKFMPQQRKKRPAPSPAGRNTAAALAAKKQKLLQQQQQSKTETEVRTPLQPAATGGLYTYEVQDEYDPRRPHDYDRLVALRKKQREIDAKMRELKEAEELDELLLKFRPHAIVNFAAESHVDRSIDGPSDFIHCNIVGVFVLLEAALAYFKGEAAPPDFRFLHVSTDEVYGSIVDGAFVVVGTDRSCPLLAVATEARKQGQSLDTYYHFERDALTWPTGCSPKRARASVSKAGPSSNPRRWSSPTGGGSCYTTGRPIPVGWSASRRKSPR